MTVEFRTFTLYDSIIFRKMIKRLIPTSRNSYRYRYQKLQRNDYELMLALTKLKGCPPAGKLVALRIKEAHK